MRSDVPTNRQYLSDLELGLRGQIDGIELEIVGYLRYQGSDDEDTWYWEEWVAVSNAKYYWIQYDAYDDEYSFFTQVAPPTKAIDVQKLRVGTRIEIEPGKVRRVSEVGSGKIVVIQGDVPWKAVTGESTFFADGSYRNERLSVEWTSSEISFYSGYTINHKKILQAFNLQDKLRQLDWREQNSVHWRKLRILFLLLGVASLIAAALAASSGRAVFSSTVTLCSATPTPTKTTCKPTLLPIGPLNLTHKNRVYTVSVQSTTASQTNWPYISIELLDSNQAALSGFAGDFWVENWREGGESGTDSNTSVSKPFRLENPGQYYLDFEIEKIDRTSTPADTFKVTVKEDVILSRYFLLTAAVAFGSILIKDRKSIG
jgi:hypothetical protein